MELVPCVPCHHRHVHALSLCVQHQGIPHAEAVVQHREHGRMLSGVLVVAVSDECGVQLPGLLQGLHPQEVEKGRPVTLRAVQLLRISDSPFPVGAADHGAHDDGFLEQALIVLTGHLTQHAAAACGLPRDGDIARIAAKGRDVARHPSQPRLLVQAAEIGRRLRLLRGEVRMGQIAEHIHPVIHGHHHDAPPGQALPVELHLRGIPALQPASEEPHQHRALLLRILRSGPHIQVQAVLVHVDLGIHMPFPAIDIGSKARNALHGNRRETICLSDALPVRRGLRGAPSVLPHRRGRKGNPLECRDPGVRRLDSAHHAVFCLCCSDHLCLLAPVLLPWDTPTAKLPGPGPSIALLSLPGVDMVYPALFQLPQRARNHIIALSGFSQEILRP